MALHLGLGSAKGVQAWMKRPHLLPAYLELWNGWLSHEHRKARDLKTPRKQGPTLATVQRTLVAEESFGDSKYSEDSPDKEDWLVEDHYARCLCRLERLNQTQKGAAMRGMAISSAD